MGAWGWSRMRIKFDAWLLLPMKPFTRTTAKPSSATFNYTHLDTIDKLVRGFRELEEKKTIREVNPWWTKMKSYL